ncbi:MAG: hypothetical protein CMP07_02675 [Xanthomonadales bacterium]|nr:hypothetical protein [Xanthomonadales bacterium]
MARLIKTLFVPYIGSWLFLLSVQQLAAQQSFEVPIDSIPVADLGLEDRVPSAFDLVGAEDGPAEQNRAALVQRLQCWIDGNEGCAVADPNDPRVRAIRRFLATGPADRHGMLVVDFPDQTRVDVRLARAPATDPNDWDQPVYEPVVLLDTVKGPGPAQGQRN